MKYPLMVTVLARILMLSKNGQFVEETVTQELFMIQPQATSNPTVTVAKPLTTRRCLYLSFAVTDLLETSQCLFQPSVSALSAAL